MRVLVGTVSLGAESSSGACPRGDSQFLSDVYILRSGLVVSGDSGLHDSTFMLTGIQPEEQRDCGAVQRGAVCLPRADSFHAAGYD